MLIYTSNMSPEKYGVVNISLWMGVLRLDSIPWRGEEYSINEQGGETFVGARRGGKILNLSLRLCTTGSTLFF